MSADLVKRLRTSAASWRRAAQSERRGIASRDLNWVEMAEDQAALDEQAADALEAAELRAETAEARVRELESLLGIATVTSDPMRFTP